MEIATWRQTWEATWTQSLLANQVLALAWEAIDIVNTFLDLGYQPVNEGL